MELTIEDFVKIMDSLQITKDYFTQPRTKSYIDKTYAANEKAIAVMNRLCEGYKQPSTESKCNKHIVIKCTTCAFDKIGLLNKNCIGCGSNFANYKSK